MKIFKREYDDKKVKKIGYIFISVFIVGWFVFRFVMISLENRIQVFNQTRDSNANGTIVRTLTVEKHRGILRYPLAVQNNRAYVSGARKKMFSVGQKIGNGKIVSISSGLDLDTGMFIIKTAGVPDGVQYAESYVNGYFLPIYAVNNGKVMVYKNGIAVSQPVIISSQDSDNVHITSGLHDGDIVILSKVSPDTKVKSD